MLNASLLALAVPAHCTKRLPSIVTTLAPDKRAGDWGALSKHCSLQPLTFAIWRTQVTGVLARRGYNVQSLAVGHSEVEGRSRITTVIPGSSASTAKLIKQLNKVINVVKVCHARGS